MNTNSKLLFLMSFLLAAVCLVDEVAAQVPSDTKAELKLRKELQVFEPFLGVWAFEGKLPDDYATGLVKRCTVGMGGNFLIERIYGKAGDGELTPLAHSVYRWDRKKNKVVIHEFRSHGSYAEVEPKIDVTEGSKPSVTIVRAEPKSPVATVEVIRPVAPDGHSWKVTMTVGLDPVAIDGIWKRK